LPFITTWDDSQNQNHPTDSAEEAYLYVSDNQISDLSVEGWQGLSRLTNLSTLFISGSALAVPDAGWEALGRLENLQALSLSGSRIGDIPAKGWEALSQLAKLEYLSMGGSGVRGIPTEGWGVLARLANMERLSLSNCDITTIPAKGWDALSRLVKLESLDLIANAFGDIPAEGWEALGRLDNMKRLWLSGNKITAVPTAGWEALSRLARLEKLDLSNNQIGDVPLVGWGSRGWFPKLQEIDLSDNPLPEEVLAAAKRGPKSLFEYLEAARLRAAHPRTVKLMLLGEPASGKTTLVEALSGNPNPCDPGRPETVGVNVRRIEKKSPEDGRPLYLATWDFAGQHMEYATHQFFLKAGGIYLILWKARLGSDYGQRDLWYWLELLKLRVKDPEFLLVTTHTSGTPAGLDLQEIQASYPGCRGHFEVELEDGTGVAALERKILEVSILRQSRRL
jgi:internalin A